MPLKFKKSLISKETYETAAAFDVDGDGIPDIVSGGWGYKGPDFEERHKICEVRSEGEYYDDFSTIPMDINGNGRMDFVTGGWFGCNLRWHENPGNLNREWSGHIIAECGNVETTRAWDVDGDGQLEIVPNTPPTPLVVYKLIQDENGKGTGEFTAHHGFSCKIEGPKTKIFIRKVWKLLKKYKKGGTSTRQCSITNKREKLDCQCWSPAPQPTGSQ